MRKPANIPQPKQQKKRAESKENVAQQQRKAEMDEVVGLHKNVGQKDHKGAR